MIAIAFTCGPVHPGLTSWVILRVPSGLIAVDNPTQGLTSLRENFTRREPVAGRAGSPGLIAICPIADLFVTTAIRISRAEKLIWTRLTLSCPFGTGFGLGSSPTDSKAL